MWEFDYKESWVPKNWCFWTVVLEKTLESPLDCKEIQPVHTKGNQSWIFIGRADAEAPILWPPDAKSWLIGKDPDAGKDWGQEEKGMTEDEMVGWHHRLDGHGFVQAPGDGKGQGSLVCCSPGVAKSWTWLRGWTGTTIALTWCPHCIPSAHFLPHLCIQWVATHIDSLSPHVPCIFLLLHLRSFSCLHAGQEVLRLIPQG